MADLRFFTRSGPFTLAHLAKVTGAEIFRGDPEYSISDVAPLDKAGEGQISFLDNVRYKDAFSSSGAAACIVAKPMTEYAPDGMALLVSKSPYKSYALAAQAFYPENWPESVISDHAHVDVRATIGAGCVIESGAVIAEGAVLGDGCWIEPNAVIGRNVVLGKRVRIGANASVSHAEIGESTRLYPGVRVGQDGFGFAMDPSGFVKVPQLGRVIIGHHVEVGANTCIDRGAGPDTVIGDGTWIDNLVQIGHNVKVGRGCVLVGQCGIAGSTVLEDYVVLAAQSGVAGHLKIGKGARIGAQAGILRDIPPGEEVMGSPAMPVKRYLRQVAFLKKLVDKSGTSK